MKLHSSLVSVRFILTAEDVTVAVGLGFRVSFRINVRIRVNVRHPHPSHFRPLLSWCPPYADDD